MNKGCGDVMLKETSRRSGIVCGKYCDDCYITHYCPDCYEDSESGDGEK